MGFLIKRGGECGEIVKRNSGKKKLNVKADAMGLLIKEVGESGGNSEENVEDNSEEDVEMKGVKGPRLDPGRKHHDVEENAVGIAAHSEERDEMKGVEGGGSGYIFQERPEVLASMAGDVRQKPPDDDLVGVVVESHGMNSVEK